MGCFITKQEETEESLQIRLDVHPKYIYFHENDDLPECQHNILGAWKLCGTFDNRPIYELGERKMFWFNDEWVMKSELNFSTTHRAYSNFDVQNPRHVASWNFWDSDGDRWRQVNMTTSVLNPRFPEDIHIRSLEELEFNASIPGTYNKTEFLYGGRPVWRKGKYILLWKYELNEWCIGDSTSKDTKYAFSPSRVLNPEFSENWKIFCGDEIGFKEDLIEILRVNALKGINDCVICMEREANTCLVPCGHVAMCRKCTGQARAKKLPCPLCRSKVDIYQPMFGF